MTTKHTKMLQCIAVLKINRQIRVMWAHHRNMPTSKDLNNNGIIQVNDDITSMDNIMLSFWTQMA